MDKELLQRVPTCATKSEKRPWKQAGCSRAHYSKLLSTRPHATEGRGRGAEAPTYVQQPSLRPESALQEFHEEVRWRGGEDGEVGLSLWTFGQSLKPLRHWLLC